MKKIIIALTLIVLACNTAAFSASTIYGISGLIETPNDVQVPLYGLGVTANFSSGLATNAISGNFASYGGAFGILRNLEISGVAATTSREDTSVQGIFNAKFRVLTETATRPSINVGVVDAFAGLNSLNPNIDNSPALFFMLGKNLTPMLEGISGTWCRPFTINVGFGSGVYKGAFVGANYSANPRFDIMFEYLTTGLSGDTDFNGGIRWYPTTNLDIKAGALDFNDFFIGASYVFQLYE